MPALEIAVTPADAGFDLERLAQVDRHFAKYVDDGRLPGWLLAISRHGQLAHLSTYGHRDVEAKLPVEADTVWRIYSMTKPITSVAALVLWERGGFELNDLVADIIPSFANQRVWRGGSSVKPETDPVVEPMRIWHLMTHTSGLTYAFVYRDAVDAIYRTAGFEPGAPPGMNLTEVCDALAELPLLFQPGTEWNYGMSTDVLALVVERIAGMPFAEFLQTEVLEPLGMNETVWHVGDDLAGRLAALYSASPDTGLAVRYDELGQMCRRVPDATFGGGGLLSTAADFRRFAEMLRGRGELDGNRILAPRTVDYMTTNHLPGNVDLTAFGRPMVSETTFDGVGFGLGVSVTIDPTTARVPGSIGDYGWGGSASTFFYVDPVEDMTVVFMSQLMPSSSHQIRSQLKQLVRAALVD